MEHYAVHGIDVSHHQGIVNWDQISRQDIHFVFAKATEGGDHVDSLFAYNWKEMRRVGLKKGAYHFFRPNMNPEIQAKIFIENVELFAGDLAPVLDFRSTWKWIKRRFAIPD